MRALRPVIASLLVVLVGAAPLGNVALAQQEQQADTVVTADALDTAIRGHVERQREAREQIVRVLQREDVQRMAAGLGIDLRDAESAVGTLEGDSLTAAAEHARTLDEALSGGAVLHISLVAALLVVIIIILLAD